MARKEAEKSKKAEALAAQQKQLELLLQHESLGKQRLGGCRSPKQRQVGSQGMEKGRRQRGASVPTA